jgi:hypothetical protein
MTALPAASARASCRRTAPAAAVRMRLVPRAAACVVATLALATGTVGGQPAGPLRVQAGVTVTPDTVTVGDPFVVQVRVAAPAGATVEFPAGPDSAGPVALLDPRRDEAARGRDGGVDVTATYRVAAWDVGPLPLGLGDAVVRAGGAERRVPLGAARVVVRSVLPADSAQRVPKPVRPPVPDAGLWWLPLALLALAALALIALLAWLARRWWLARRRAVPGDLAYASAVAAFDRLHRLRLVEAGEGGRHVALASDIVRDYLAARVPAADRSLTSGELAAALAGSADVPGDRLAALLAAADLVKFAGVGLRPDDAAERGREARRVVDETEEAVRARLEREAADEAERARAERDARRRYEEERRRAARHARRNGAAGTPESAPSVEGRGRERAA